MCIQAGIGLPGPPVITERPLARKKRQKLGEILVNASVCTEAQVEEASTLARSSGKRLGEALIEIGACKRLLRSLMAACLLDAIGSDAVWASGKVQRVALPSQWKAVQRAHIMNTRICGLLN